MAHCGHHERLELTKSMDEGFYYYFQTGLILARHVTAEKHRFV
jgi:hypothetical protein